MLNHARRLALLALVMVFALVPLVGCASPQRADPDATVIYEANIRQHTRAGTFDAFRARLDELEEMGVGILWLMPIHPIGHVERKGTLGSYYAVRDYYDVNPEFGDLRDLDELVDAAHARGMLVILDWVANHTAWDHPWTASQPEYYRLDDEGNFTTPNGSWTDVLQLDLSRDDTRAAMKEAMLYWVREHDIDGFRADVAELVPRAFWEDVIAEARRIRPVYMLAEGADDWLLEAGFDATYGWGLGVTLIRVHEGSSDAMDVRAHVEERVLTLDRFGRPKQRMHFTTNHDWNSWEAVALERFGEAWEAATVLTYTLPGTPMVYSGQVAGLDKQIAFFDRDPIAWREHPARALYEKLGRLKNENRALLPAQRGSRFRWLDLGDPERVLAFARTNGVDEVVTVVNLSGTPATLDAWEAPGWRYRDLEGEPKAMPSLLPACGWVVLERVARGE
jgi:cyclomaltodextrinase / maltogenic alpha-amylase / neopullulanase